MSETRYVGRVTGGTPNKRKRVLLLAGGGVGIIAVWYVLQRHKASAAVAAADPSADTTSTDSTGLDTGSSPVLSSYTDPGTGAIISGGGWNAGPNSIGTQGTQVISAPSTNAQWTQQAIAYLVQNGFDPIGVSIALGKYLANQNLSDDEYAIVQAAIAAEGSPPSPVPPPHVAPPAGQTPTTNVTSSVTKPATPTGFHIASLTRQTRKVNGSAVLQWDGMPGANEYRLHYNGVPVKTVSGTSVTVHRNGFWRVASVRGAYTSPYSPRVEVKGI